MLCLQSIEENAGEGKQERGSRRDRRRRQRGGNKERAAQLQLRWFRIEDVPVGRLASTQAEAVADLAERDGDGEVRLSPSENHILTQIADRHLPALLGEPLLRELRPDPSPTLRGTVACTGIGLCDLALTDTKVHALAVARRLEHAGRLHRPGGMPISSRARAGGSRRPAR